MSTHFKIPIHDSDRKINKMIEKNTILTEI